MKPILDAVPTMLRLHVVKISLVADARILHMVVAMIKLPLPLKMGSKIALAILLSSVAVQTDKALLKDPN